MNLALVCALLAAPYAPADSPRTRPSSYDVSVTVGWHGQTYEKCAIDLLVNGAVAGHAVTREDGRARFDGLATERFELLVRRAGFFDRRVIIYDFARRDLHEEIELEKRVRWQLAGTVRGGGAMIRGAQVKLTEGGDAPAQVATGADGVFTFPALFGTACRFSVEAPGFHRQLVWMENRAQTNLVTDVELARGPGAPWMRGEPEPRAELRLLARPPRRLVPADAVRALFDVSRILPADDRPAGALTGARLDLTGRGAPRGAMARLDRALRGLVQPYPRRRPRR